MGLLLVGRLTMAVVAGLLGGPEDSEASADDHAHLLVGDRRLLGFLVHPDLLLDKRPLHVQLLVCEGELPIGIAVGVAHLPPRDFLPETELALGECDLLCLVLELGAHCVCCDQSVPRVQVGRAQRIRVECTTGRLNGLRVGHRGEPDRYRKGNEESDDEHECAFPSLYHLFHPHLSRGPVRPG